MSPSPARQRAPGTIDDLVADAAGMGQTVTPRLVTDWVAHGLLDSGPRRSAGQGKGSDKALFSSNQRQLFQVLIQKRSETNRLAHLTTIPLVLWAYWGDDYVPTRQAAKALETSLESREQPKIRAEKKARELVEQVRHTDASPTSVNRLRRLVTETLTAGRIKDPQDLERTFTKVFDPHSVGRRILPGIDIGISVSPTQVVGAAMMRERAITAFLGKRVTTDHLDRVRIELQETFVEYAQRSPLYVALSGQRLVDVAVHHEFQRLADGIVPNIWLVLGALLATERQGASKPPRQTLAGLVQ